MSKSAYLLVKILSVVFITATISGCAKNHGEVEVINVSSKLLDSVRVSVCGQILMLESVRPAEHRKLNFEISGESEYEVVVAFHDHSELRRKIGYLSSGFDAHNVLSIADTDVALSVEK